MKRGAAMLGTIVRFIPHLVILLFVGGVFYGAFIHPLLFPPLTAPDKNVVRLYDNLGQIITQPMGQVLPVFLTAEDHYTIEIFPAGSPVSPPRCEGQACICLWQLKGKPAKQHQTCKPYPELGTCAPSQEICGLQPCIRDYKKIVVDKDQPTAVRIARECNTVRIV